MNVELLQYPEDPERAVATAARLCYAPVGAKELMETMPPERVESVLSTIMKSGHFSTLEHVSYTFAVDGVSRALTHQLVRHRLASFNQQSQRYVKFTAALRLLAEAESLKPWQKTNMPMRCSTKLSTRSLLHIRLCSKQVFPLKMRATSFLMRPRARSLSR